MRAQRDYTISRVPDCLSLRPNCHPTPSPASECMPPWAQRGGGGILPRGRGSQFVRLERKPGTLYALCVKGAVHYSTDGGVQSVQSSSSYILPPATGHHRWSGAQKKHFKNYFFLQYTTE